MAIVITTTSDDKNELEAIARQLVNDRLAACCQIVGPITSIYRWDEKIDTSLEWMCLIKTDDELYDKVEHLICQHHHYDQPQVISTPIVRGSTGYLEWISGNVAPHGQQ